MISTISVIYIGLQRENKPKMIAKTTGRSANETARRKHVLRLFCASLTLLRFLAELAIINNILLYIIEHIILRRVKYIIHNANGRL